MVMWVTGKHTSHNAFIVSCHQESESENPQQQRICDAVDSGPDEIAAESRVHCTNTLYRNCDLLQAGATFKPSLEVPT